MFYPDRVGVFDFNDDPENGFQGPSQAVMDASLQLAGAMYAGMKEGLSGLYDGAVLGDSRSLVGSQQGALTVSIFSNIPTVLVEMAVLSDPEQARFIGSEAGQERMAQSIAAGILRYKP